MKKLIHWINGLRKYVGTRQFKFWGAKSINSAPKIKIILTNLTKTCDGKLSACLALPNNTRRVN